MALFEINARSRSYSSFTWNVLEYLALFLIVLVHEFGHALACRQVGGVANQIVLWPLGGVAYVNPPPRPGATLWSIAAGPLVNVVLVPVLLALGLLSPSWSGTFPNVYVFLHAVWVTNLVLLVFNLMPVYPLDGGQILRSLLWFILGRARSLMVAAVIGLFGVVGFLGLAFWIHSVWFGIMAVFLLMNCWGGLRQAKKLSEYAKLPRRQGVACPSCKAAPPLGEFWNCSHCQQPFDTFATQATCPYCSSQFSKTRCLDCGQVHSMAEWMTPLAIEAKA